ncbi:hypothetical protein IWT140_01654 [Secundilactobacillus pentosiphilus]|uniref:DUF1659 domain-containing protein n=1 Tax=Secundilactobacillus pentosiphilus TaxID=1714682 RepID=A0A1Z5IQL6_9LACO|nr:hypothetical protein [Secundilactobacillus pentosiphilus]GAX04020.1 hypothetical protein IWT140_01654 [Secundilactobacillus pentosiphilus]GAX07230.1 hypothetical protein IWT25_02583 [Secundilactobacillus pentosiphilus]
MNTSWNKTNLTLIMLDADDNKVRLSYNNVVEKPSDDQIKAFAAVVEKLTDLTFFSASLTTTDNKTQVA